MDKEKKTGRIGGFVKRRKRLIIALALVVMLAAAGGVYMGLFNGEKDIGFEEVEEKKLPSEITSEIIPEYKSLERALACSIDDDIYVVVTRGEKPSSGFQVDVDRLVLQEEDGDSTLIVYAGFKDPDKDTAFSQILTYPVQVVKTDLKALPDDIELRIQY